MFCSKERKTTIEDFIKERLNITYFIKVNTEKGSANAKFVKE